MGGYVMDTNKKLKVLVGILFSFIIILVVLLVYAKTVYDKNDTKADSTISASSGQTAASSTDSSDQSAASSSEVQNIDLKLYFFDADNYDSPKEIRTIAVDKKLYEQDITAAINEVLSSTKIKINKAVKNGEAIKVDLTKEAALVFNNGSAGGITNTNILAATIVNLPGISQMEVTVDGKSGVIGDHFSFNGTFAKSESGRMYTFTESDKDGKEITY
jgi:hypothetical protein